MAWDIRGQFRRAQKSIEGTFREFRASGFGSIFTAQVEDRYVELTRGNRRFTAWTKSTWIPPQTTFPTTTAIPLAMFNGDPSRSYVLDMVSFSYTGNGTSTNAAGATLLATVSTNAIAIAQVNSIAANISTIMSCSGSVAQSRAIFVAAGLNFPTKPAPAWLPIQSTFQAASAGPGTGDMWAMLEGRLIIPPGYAAGFAIMSGAGSNSPQYDVSIAWSELELDLE